jgi:hypothetical protein
MCTLPPGSNGNGYVASFTGLVKSGVCRDCLDTTDTDLYVEGFGARIPPFCDMLALARRAAAGALGKCAAPALTLLRTCHYSRSFPGTWSMDFVFSGTCAGDEAKTISVEGGWQTRPDGSKSPVAAKAWKWTTA